MDLLTSAQMRAVERDAIDADTVTGLELMERAGRGVVDAVLAQWPELAQTSHHAVILCGPGNNGGDGFVVARLLKQRGWEVEVFLFGDADRLPADARKMHDLWVQIGEVSAMTPAAAGLGQRPALLVDAVFGTGLSRPIPRDCALSFQAVARRTDKAIIHMRVVAVDVPSGMDADSGAVLLPPCPGGDAEQVAQWQAEVQPYNLPCDLCVTFHRAKPAHYLSEVGENRPVIVDIGLPEGRAVADMLPLSKLSGDGRVRLICPATGAQGSNVAAWLKKTAYSHLRGGHKYDRGHALILGGGTGHGGAARLAARAALRVGAGLATLGVPHEALAENAAQLNAIMLREIGDATALAKTLEGDRLTALCIGPGLGVGQGREQDVRDLVAAALAASDLPQGKRRYVLDADALTAFRDDPETLFAMLHEACVLTPHEGEFARLFPDLAERNRHQDCSIPPMSKVEAVQRSAKRAGCTILLKGPATVIASPDGTVSIHAALYDRRADWLGTAGAGDVLAGMITGLMANGRAGGHIHQIVEVAAYLHIEAARSFGAGLIAEDLPEELPKVFRAIGL
ncbi:NAD(P)H-hydrate dehydratase [Celeribacter sp.]|uniref:NAD(P)H-hydrate dehydratase n=1 Tax=Celeribacter sp. TaxID=1890673 RepID=UPI003A8DD7E0